MPVVVEILRIKLNEQNIDFDQLANVNWSNEKQTIIDILRAMFEFAETTDLNFDNPDEILGNSNLPVALKNIGNTLNNSSLFKDVLLVYLNDIVKDSLSTIGEEYKSLSTKFKFRVEKDMKMLMPRKNIKKLFEEENKD